MPVSERWIVDARKMGCITSFPFIISYFYTELDKKIYDIIKTRLILVSLSDDHHDEYIETNICSAVMYTDYMYTPTNGVFRPPREFFTHLETSPWRLGTANVHLCSTLMAIEQRGWGFFSVSILLWHGSSAYKCHLRGPDDTHIYCRAFDSGAVTTCFNDLGSV